MDGEGGFNLGRSSEILRDELKFTKFVGRLRKRFSNMFNDMLKTQLILKNVCTPEDWELWNSIFNMTSYMITTSLDLKDSELTEKLNMVATAEPYVGKYFSQDYLRRKILRQTDEEILEQDQLIEKEIKKGIIPDPATIDPATGLPFEDPNINGEMGAVPVEPEIDGSATEAPEMPKGGEI